MYDCPDVAESYIYAICDCNKTRQMWVSIVKLSHWATFLMQNYKTRWIAISNRIWDIEYQMSGKQFGQQLAIQSGIGEIKEKVWRIMFFPHTWKQT